MPNGTRRIAAALLVFATACSNDLAGPPTFTPLDVTRVLSEMSPSVLATAGAAMPLGATLPALPLSAAAANCPYNSAARAFTCDAITANGLTVTLSYTLADINGVLLTKADPAVVATIHTSVNVTGTIAQNGISMAIVQHSEQTMSGLLAATRILDGVATSNATLTVAGTAPVTVKSTQTTMGLLLPAASSASATSWPKGGTVVSDVSTTGGALSFASRAMIMFDGTSIAKLTLTNNGTTQNCTLNLAAPSAPACTA